MQADGVVDPAEGVSTQYGHSLASIEAKVTLEVGQGKRGVCTRILAQKKPVAAPLSPKITTNLFNKNRRIRMFVFLVGVVRNSRTQTSKKSSQKFPLRIRMELLLVGLIGLVRRGVGKAVPAAGSKVEGPRRSHLGIPSFPHWTPGFRV